MKRYTLFLGEMRDRDSFTTFDSNLSRICKRSKKNISNHTSRVIKTSLLPTIREIVEDEKKPTTKNLFSDEQTKILKEFFCYKIYPDEDEKSQLAELTGLQKNQVKDWFINTRKRYTVVPEQEKVPPQQRLKREFEKQLTQVLVEPQFKKARSCA